MLLTMENPECQIFSTIRILVMPNTSSAILLTDTTQPRIPQGWQNKPKYRQDISNHGNNI